MANSHPRQTVHTSRSRAFRSGSAQRIPVLLIEAHLWRYALYRAYLNLVGEASRYYLGWLWWLLEPIAMTGVFYLVFTYIRQSNIENFAYFLIVGITMWLWFANGVANSTDCISVSRSIISQMRVPKLLFPDHCRIFGHPETRLRICHRPDLDGSGIQPEWGMALPYPCWRWPSSFMILAVGSTVAFVCCWVRDFRFIIRSGLTLMMFCSGIFYSVHRMAPEHQELFRINPMFVMIEQYRLVLLDGSAPDLFWCAKVGAVGMLWLWGVRLAFEHFDRTLTRRVIDG